MFSRFRSIAVFTLVLTCTAALPAQTQRELRVCADGDNLPYSNRNLQGLDNKIADLLARDLNAKITYYWSRMGRGYVRDIVNAGECDVLIEIPINFPQLLVTPSYYQSSYVFVTRADRNLRIATLDDPRLHQLRIGVQIVAENYSPPGEALARRGIYSNLVAFENTGDEAGEIINAVANGKVDVSIAWGPLAGYYAKQQKVALDIVPVSPAFDRPGIPFRYSMSMGVSKRHPELRDELTAFLARHKSDIDAVLRSYGVPRTDEPDARGRSGE